MLDILNDECNKRFPILYKDCDMNKDVLQNDSLSLLYYSLPIVI